MSQNLLDIAKLPVEMQKRNQPIFVSGDIENMQVANFIHGTKHYTQFRETAEFGALYCLAPRLQWPAGIAMDNGKFQQATVGDDSHGRRLLQNAIRVKQGCWVMR